MARLVILTSVFPIEVFYVAPLAARGILPSADFRLTPPGKADCFRGYVLFGDCRAWRNARSRQDCMGVSAWLDLPGEVIHRLVL